MAGKAVAQPKNRLRQAMTTGNPVIYDGFLYILDSKDNICCKRVCDLKQGIVRILDGTQKMCVPNLSSDCTIKTEKLILPSSMQSIGESALYKTSIDSIDFGGTKRIGPYAFSYAELGNIVLPESVGTIGAFAFAQSDVLSLKLSSGIRTIGKCAFCGSTLDMLDMSMCADLSVLHEGMFAGCHKLLSVNLPPNLTKIERGAFSDAGLLFINMEYLNIREIPHECFAGSEDMKIISLPKMCQIVEYDAFKGCTQLERIYASRGTVFRYKSPAEKSFIDKRIVYY